MKTSRDIEPSADKESQLFKEERLFNEINLLRIEGFYFCLDPKEASRRKHEQYEFFEIIKKPGEIEKHPVVILANDRYGYPSTLAYKVLQAIVKKLSDYGYPVPNTVYFSQRELARLIGRQSIGGRDQKQLYNAIKQLQNTEIRCRMYEKATKQWAEADFRILNTSVFAGRKNQITQCFVRIDDSIVNNLNNRYALCLNYSRMESLEPISMALYKRLFFHFSNIYSFKKHKDLHIKKDYADICVSWLGGLRVLKYKSKILNEQLGTHLQALKKTRLISKYTLEKNAKGDGFNVMFYPGPGFFADYTQFYAKQFQLPMQFAKAADARRGEEPLALVAYFYSQLYPSSESADLVLSEKETDLALLLLERFTYDDIKDLIAFSISQSKKDHFDIRSFGAVKSYLGKWEAFREERAEQESIRRKQAAEEREMRLRDQYDAYWRKQIEEIRTTISPDELTGIENIAREEIETDNTNPMGRSLLLRLKTDSLLTQRYRILPFEEWKLQISD